MSLPLLCNGAREFMLAELVLFKTNGEGLDPPRSVFGHQRYYRARVDAARQERAERHVGNQMQLYAFIEAGGCFFDHAGAAAQRLCFRQLPIARKLADFSSSAYDHVMRGRKTPDSLDDRARLLDRAEA